MDKETIYRTFMAFTDKYAKAKCEVDAYYRTCQHRMSMWEQEQILETINNMEALDRIVIDFFNELTMEDDKNDSKQT